MQCFYNLCYDRKCLSPLHNLWVSLNLENPLNSGSRRNEKHIYLGRIEVKDLKSIQLCRTRQCHVGLSFLKYLAKINFDSFQSLAL